MLKDVPFLAFWITLVYMLAILKHSGDLIAWYPVEKITHFYIDLLIAFFFHNTHLSNISNADKWTNVQCVPIWEVQNFSNQMFLNFGVLLIVLSYNL